MRTRTLQLLLALPLVAACSARTLAQDDTEDFTGVRPDRPTAPGRAPITTRGSNEVELNVRSYGVGGVTRPGEWAGVWIEVDDHSEKVRNVLIRIRNADLDGDTAQMQRVIVTNPGSVQRVWLYTHIKFAMEDEVEIVAHDAVEAGRPDGGVGGGGGGGEEQKFTAGRLLGSLRYRVNTRQVAQTEVGLIGIVGSKPAGLDQYRWTAEPREGFSITGHELIGAVGGLSVQSLPERWYGYSQFDALAWTSAATEDSPLNIGAYQAEAIAEYVKRGGGHFIIVLPVVAQAWIAQPSNPLADIMPAVRITRTEGVALEKYRSLLTRDPVAELPPAAVVQTFTPLAAGGWSAPEAVPIMTGPDGECVVVRRHVGAGMVTVIGIDVTSELLHRKSHAFMSEQFWNRILGKRQRTPTQLELSAASKNNGKLPDGAPVDVWQTSANSRIIDNKIISESVNNEGSAATGLLLACVVFAAYWLIAGPVGFFILKQRHWRQHAWVAFVLATGVFTAIAWGGANILRPRRVHGKHLTIVDGVYGQPVQRARSWMGLFLPRYGEHELSVAAPPGPTGAPEWKNLITTWDPADKGSSSAFARFPDARGYVMDVRHPDTAAFPSRATTKQVQVEWAGNLPANWTLPHPISTPDIPIGREIRIVERPDPKPGEPKWKVEGSLTHSLPQPLTNVKIFLVRDPLSPGSQDQWNSLRRRVSKQEVAEWKPGGTLDLDTFFSKSMSDLPALEALDKQIIPAGSTMGAMIDQAYAPSQFAVASAFMDYAQPPAPGSSSGTRNVLARTATHGLDLSRWFTQPCLIVIGEIGADAATATECPIPIRVDSLSGDEVRTRIKGRTIVRWVYPMEPVPFTTYTLPPLLKPAGGSGKPGDGGNGPDQNGGDG